MSGPSSNNKYHIARRVGYQGTRPPVRNQAGVEKYATGSVYSNHEFSSCQVVIEPLNVKRLRQLYPKNLENLTLPQPDAPSSSRKRCGVTVNVPPNFSDRFKKPLTVPRDNRRRCQVCHVTVKGYRGLVIHLNRSPNCKRNVSKSGQGTMVGANDAAIDFTVSGAVGSATGDDVVGDEDGVVVNGVGGSDGSNEIGGGLGVGADVGGVSDVTVVDGANGGVEVGLNDVSADLPQQISEVVRSPSTSIESLENLCNQDNTSKICIHPHKNNRDCLLCCVLDTKDKFVSSSTHRTYQSVIPDDIDKVDCKTENVVYLITCRKCKLQYVGETVQLLRGRISAHTNSLDNPNKDHHCRILVDHFSSGMCQGATFKVNIIEKLSGTGRDEEGTMDPGVSSMRRKKEREWMLRLRTVYPFGLNDRVGDEYMAEKDQVNIFSKFPPLKRIKEHQKVRTKRPVCNTFLVDNFIYIINESLRTNLRNTNNLIRVLLSSLKRSSCRILFGKISDFISNKHDTYRFFQFWYAALDIIRFKIGKPSQSVKSKKAAPANRCHISFNNKALDFISFGRILRDKEVIKALPSNLRQDSPTIVYQLTDTIRSKLFNYKEFVQSIDVDAFLADNSILPCDCASSSFVNHDHGHIMSGDLNIISDPKLRSLISKGPKYREPLPFSCDRAKDEILVGLDNCIDSWCNKAGLPKASFREWKEMIIDRINKRISSLDERRKKTSFYSILKSSSSSSCLTDLHSKYVMVPIDKAGNNIAFICKRFYATVLMKELGLGDQSTSTYTRIFDQTPDDIISMHQQQMKEDFNVDITDDMKTLPDIYWIPKLHKNPAKFRFIIASKHCTTKHISKNLSSIFTLFQKQIDLYYAKAHFYSGIKSYWIIQNRDPVLRAVKKSCVRKSAKCVSSFDFSTLYTKIPHDKLIDVLNKIIDFVFKGGTRNKISVNRSGHANWVKDGERSSYVYSKDLIHKAVAFLIQNAYFKLGNKLFRQDIGIPMGSDPAPAFANLFLFHYESSWLLSVKKSNNILARKFGQVFRYIDDLLALNDGHSFEANYQDIYPPELQLNKENEGYSSTDFLDMHIEIQDKVFTTRLYDKRDHFGFDITRLPYRDSNIPAKMFYSSIAAECLRICQATTLDTYAKSSIKSVVTRMVNQGANISRTKATVIKSLNRHNISNKFGYNDNSFVNKLFK